MTLEHILQSNIAEEFKQIAKKVTNQERITVEEGVLLFEKADPRPDRLLLLLNKPIGARRERNALYEERIFT